MQTFVDLQALESHFAHIPWSTILDIDTVYISQPPQGPSNAPPNGSNLPSILHSEADSGGKEESDEDEPQMVRSDTAPAIKQVHRQ